MTWVAASAARRTRGRAGAAAEEEAELPSFTPPKQPDATESVIDLKGRDEPE